MKLYMKILAVVAVIAFSSTASAANSLKKGSMALNVSVFDGTSAAAFTNVANGGADDLFIVQGKYFVQKGMAILAGVGIGIKGGDANGTDFGFRGGVRKYLKTSDFAPFVGGYLAYVSTQDSTVKATQIMGEAGAEYFFSKNFSVEGAARAGYTSAEYIDATTALKVKATNIGTASAGVSFNFYF